MSGCQHPHQQCWHNALQPIACSTIDGRRTRGDGNELFGTLAMCRAFAPVLKRNGGGTLVNMLSVESWYTNLLSGSFINLWLKKRTSLCRCCPGTAVSPCTTRLKQGGHTHVTPMSCTIRKGGRSMNRSGEILLHPCYAHDASDPPQRGQNRASGRSSWYLHTLQTLAGTAWDSWESSGLVSWLSRDAK